MKKKSATAKRRDYQRGYKAGKRNKPFSMLFLPNFDASRGWGAGQAWLERKTK